MTDKYHKTQGQQWTKTASVLCWSPETMKAKLDRNMHTLTITTRMECDPRQTTYQPKRKQVIPLPHDIDMTQLRVHLKPEEQQLVLMAPLQRPKDIITKQQKHKYQHQQQLITLRRQQFPEEFESLYTPILIRDTQPLQIKQQKKTQKKQKRTPYPGTLQTWSWFGSGEDVSTLDDKMLTTKVEKDDKTGKWNLLIDVNTVVGFQKREVKVTFEDEEEPIIVVEATRDISMMQKGKENKAEVFVKVLREEIVVPKGVEGKQLRYYITKSGVLRVQLPCQRNPAKSQQEQEKNTEQE